MSLLTNVAAAALVAAAVAGGVAVVARWKEAPPEPREPASHGSASRDEAPLQTGFVKSDHVGMVVGRGYPWLALRDRVAPLKRDLPPEPGAETSVDREKRFRLLLQELRFTLPSGRVPWPKFVAALRARIEPHGVRISTGPTDIPESYTVDLPAREWGGLEIFGHLHNVTNRWLGYEVTCDGVGFGTDAWVNRVRRDATLGEYNRRLAEEQRAAPLDVEFRPDVFDADVVNFLRTIEDQTGVEVVLDPAIWEMLPSVIWRGPPRPLRDALTELCSRFRWYWRWSDGRVWLLKP